MRQHLHCECPIGDGHCGQPAARIHRRMSYLKGTNTPLTYVEYIACGKHDHVAAFACESTPASAEEQGDPFTFGPVEIISLDRMALN